MRIRTNTDTKRERQAMSLATVSAVLLASLLIAACGAGNGDSSRRAADAASGKRVAARTSVPWWLRTRPLGLAVTRRLLRRTHLPAALLVEDGRILASYYGYVATPEDKRAVTAVVKRYYPVAVSGDGRRACALMASSAARSAVANFGRLGTSYLRGARTCPQVLSRMFKHRHGELTQPIAVTGVLTRADHAFAIVDSPKMPDSIVSLQREDGAWRVNTPLPAVIPVAK